jgi:hypothetical protein
MRRRELMAAVAALGVATTARAAAAKQVVLELFTSQGCSSCPPADALLGKLTQRPGVIGLAWHIDYWDNLGWRDPFASRLATERQKAYARALNDEVYTPALVVNGTRMVVGSDGGAIESAIGAAAPLSVAVSLTPSADGLVADIGAAPGALRAVLAIYDPEHATDVRAGENQGARLREYRTVRKADVLAEWDGAARRLSLPRLAAGQGAVVLVQSAQLRVVGAAELPAG